MPTKQALISFYVPPALKAELQQCAQDLDRTMSSLLRQMVKANLKIWKKRKINRDNHHGAEH